jgi:hypothetical protein
MKKAVELYFIYFLKPSMLVACFVSNVNFLINAEFSNTFSFIMTLFCLMIKPIFFILLYVLFTMKIELKTFFQHFLAFGIVLLIYFGFPIKEYSDLIKMNELNKFFEGKEYVIDEFMYNHFVCNAALENIPVLLIVISDNIIQAKWEGNRYFPILIHSIFLLFYGIVLQHVFNKKR